MTSTSIPRSLFCVVCGGKINDPPSLHGPVCDDCGKAVAVPARIGFQPRTIGRAASRER